MKTIACIPVHGRLPLLHITITRLLKKNGLHSVICAGATDEEKEACERAGATFIYHENQPLGRKWNAAFQVAGEHDPDNILFVGSSDWVSDNWMSVMGRYMDQFDMIGLPDFYLADIGPQIRVCHWAGYGRGPRMNEPIGIGRVISARSLKKMSWMPFDDTKSNSMDATMFARVLANGGAVKMLRTPDIKSLSISCPKWSNMHLFEDHWRNKLPSEKIYDHSFLPTYFPEAFDASLR
jgi:glycosyltransferase involved in cell wall biosynthesis